MAKPLHRLQRFLRRTQLLLLFLGVAYIMAGSVLLLQRSSLAVSQRGGGGGGAAAGGVAAPPPALEPPVLREGRPRQGPWAGRYGAAADDRGSPRWLVSRNLEIRQLRRRWFHSLMSEQEGPRAERTQPERTQPRRKIQHKGMAPL